MTNTIRTNNHGAQVWRFGRSPIVSHLKTTIMANEKKEWKELLESTNKKLLERGFELRIHEDEEGYYSLDTCRMGQGT